MVLIIRGNDITQPRYQHTISTLVPPSGIPTFNTTLRFDKTAGQILKCSKYGNLSKEKKVLHVYTGTMVSKLIGCGCRRTGYCLKTKIVALGMRHYLFSFWWVFSDLSVMQRQICRQQLQSLNKNFSRRAHSNFLRQKQLI